MTNYLLHDAACPVCANIASRVESVSDGWLTVRSIDDPEMASIVAAHAPDLGRKPCLILDREHGTKVLTGAPMSIAMTRALGLRRALKVSGIIHDALREGDPTGRRSFLRTVGIGAAVVSGFALGGPATASGSNERHAVLDPSAAARLRDEAKANTEYRAAMRAAKAHGYDFTISDSVAIDLGDGDRLLFTFIGHEDRPETDAAVISYERVAGVVTVMLESVSGDPEAAAASSRLNEVLTVSPLAIGGSDVVPLGKMDYFGCVTFCVGANCSSKARHCAKLRFMALVLACMVGVCGSKVNSCHKVCKSKW
ncbi:hypothetical protein [Thalassiella azotivora]